MSRTSLIIEVVTPGVIFGNISPGEKVSKKLYIELTENVNPGDTLRFRAEIFSEGIHYWTDTVDFVMPFNAIEQELADISVSNWFPNPFSSNTEMEFTLKEPSNVTISVINILGQQVGYWHEDSDQTGTFKVAWIDIIGLNEEASPGFYTCILTKNGAPAGVMKLVKE